MHRLAKNSLLILATISLSACVYRLNIQQGNFVDVDRLVQVEVGMDERQVAYLLGDPVAKDSFVADRWTYVYYLKRGDWDEDEAFVREVVINFDDEGIVSSIEGAEYAHELNQNQDEFAEDEIGDAVERVEDASQ
jgi:outer membrane protein assembly factor BamE